MGCNNSKAQKSSTSQPKKSIGSNGNSVEALPTNRPIIIFIAGGPGCGKGTQCSKIVSEFGFHHISTGDVLRAEVQSNGTDAEELKNIMKSGHLVPSELLVRLIRKKVKSMNVKRDVFLLDGFPRNLENLEEWDRQLSKFAEVKFLLNFECSNETMTSRILERAKESSREDDNPDVIKTRIQVYHQETEPVINKLKKQGKIVCISVETDPDTVYCTVKKELESHGLSKTVKKPILDITNPEEEKKADEMHKKKEIAIKPPTQAVPKDQRKDLPRVIFFCGPPASGKKYQTTRLLDKFIFEHIDVKSISEKGDGKESTPGELVEGILKKIDEKKGDNKFFLITGFPSCQKHMEAWNTKAPTLTKVIAVIHLNVEISVAAKRMGKKIEDIKPAFDSYSKDIQPVLDYLDDEDLLVQVDNEEDKYRTTVALERILESKAAPDKSGLNEKRKKMPKVFVILGGPGSNKKNYLTLACKDTKIITIDTATTVKRLREDETSEVGRKIDYLMDNGVPVSNELRLEAILSEILMLNNECGKSFALTGFAKNEAEANILLKCDKIIIKKVVLVDASEEKMKKQLLKYIDEKNANEKISKWNTLLTVLEMKFKNSGNHISKVDANGSVKGIADRLTKRLSRNAKK